MIGPMHHRREAETPGVRRGARILGHPSNWFRSVTLYRRTSNCGHPPLTAVSCQLLHEQGIEVASQSPRSSRLASQSAGIIGCPVFRKNIAEFSRGPGSRVLAGRLRIPPTTASHAHKVCGPQPFRVPNANRVVRRFVVSDTARRQITRNVLGVASRF